MYTTLFSTIEFQQESIIYKLKQTWQNIFLLFLVHDARTDRNESIRHNFNSMTALQAATTWILHKGHYKANITVVLVEDCGLQDSRKLVIYIYWPGALLYFHQNYLESQIAYKHPITFNYVYLKHLQRNHKVPWTCSSQVSECYKLLPFLASEHLSLPSKKWGRRQMNPGYSSFTCFMILSCILYTVRTMP